MRAWELRYRPCPCLNGQIASRLGNRSLSVVVGCIGMAGNPSAAAAAAEFIQSHQPKAFFLLGIAAALAISVTELAWPYADFSFVNVHPSCTSYDDADYGLQLGTSRVGHSRVDARAAHLL